MSSQYIISNISNISNISFHIHYYIIEPVYNRLQYLIQISVYLGILIKNNYLLSIIVLLTICGFVELHSNNLCIEIRTINIFLLY